MKTYNPDYKRRYPELSFAALRSKLVAAVAMLVVAATLLATASYAWFVLSTAPEVTGIDTQVGANGALEIALLNSESWEDLSKLDMGDFDESMDGYDGNNLSWGNLIDLSDSSYGLGQIVLQPARLNIAQNGNDADGNPQYKVQSTILKTPVYGEDGRIQSLDATSAVGYVCQGGKFTQLGYGVRAIGTCAGISVFQMGMNTAKSLLSQNMSAAKTTASKALSDNGAALANIVVAHALDEKNDGFTTADVQAVKDLATGMKSALDNLDAALRQAFVAYAATPAANVSADDFETAQTNINKATTSLSSLLTDYPGITSMVPNMSTYITTLTADQTKVDNAISACTTKINAGETCTWGEISDIVEPLVDTDQMTLGGKSIDEVKEEVMGEGDAINYSAAMALIQGGLTIGVPSGSGLLSDIADYAGDYAAAVTLESVSAGGYDLNDMTVTIKTVTSKNPIYLTACNQAMRSAIVSTASGSSASAMTDFYGYALDLAFRTNAQGSKLQLQTEPENRIYEGDTQNASLQGGGSYMSFATGSLISATKMVKLMSGVRVVLMDDEQVILGIATLDCALGKDLYTELTDEIKNTHSDLDFTGMTYYLNASTGGLQQSDLISAEAYDALPETSAVQYDSTTGELKAKLYLHDFSMTVSTGHTEEEITANGGNFYTGGITIGAKKADSAITKLTQDTAKRITSVVYIDGSVVTNATVAANAQYSMTGTLNLQFSSDATLIPATNTALQSGEAKFTAIAAAGTDYTFEGTTYTVNSGYSICKKSTDPYNVYFHNVASSAEETAANHIKLTNKNVSTALTKKTS